MKLKLKLINNKTDLVFANEVEPCQHVINVSSRYGCPTSPPSFSPAINIFVAVHSHLEAGWKQTMDVCSFNHYYIL